MVDSEVRDTIVWFEMSPVDSSQTDVFQMPAYSTRPESHFLQLELSVIIFSICRNS